MKIIILVRFCTLLSLILIGFNFEATAQALEDSQTTLSIDKVQNSGSLLQVDTITIDSGLEKKRSDLVTAPGSLVQKSRETIELVPNAKLSDVLVTEPNIRFYGGPREGAELPQIRGMQSERILILEEGVRQNYQSQHTGRVFTDFSTIENVEVVKGPWSSLYGSGAMGGVISYRRATAGDYLRRANVSKKQYMGGELSLDNSLASDGAGQRMTVFGRVEKWEPLLSYRAASAGDVRLSTGEDLKYSATETKDLYTSQTFIINPKQALNLKMNHYTSEGRIPLNPALNQTKSNQIGDSTVVKKDIVADYQYRGAQADIHFKPFVRETDVERVRVSDRREDDQSVKTTGVDTWVTIDNVWSEQLKSASTFGVETFRDENNGARNGATLASFPNGTTEQTGVYFQPTVVLAEKWTITPGVRYDSFKNTSQMNGVAANSGEEVSRKLYVSHEYLADKKIFAGWGEAFNAPRLQDIYLTDMHFPGNFFVPSPELQPEKSNTVEIGTKNTFRLNESNAMTADFTAFQTDSRDFISRDVKATTTQLKNIDSVGLKGLEGSVGWQGLSSSVKLAYGQVRSRDHQTAQPLKDTPADQWAVSLEKFAGDNLRVGTEFIITESQDRVPTVLQPGDLPVSKTGGYSVQNVFLQYRAAKGVTFNARVNNIWDKEYKPHGESIAQVGRDVRAGLSWLF